MRRPGAGSTRSPTCASTASRRKPAEALEEERTALRPLPAALYDVGAPRLVHATRRCRVHFDGNRYSVPPVQSGARLTLCAYPEKILVYDDGQLVAEHVRSYERGADVENPEHVRLLLARRPRAYSSEYVANLLEQRRRFQEPPGPLHLTCGQDLLLIDLPEPNLDLYPPKENP
jgi:hypothetical protein